MKDIEHRLQVACVRWMRFQHPNVLIFAIPNGGQRSVITAKRLKDEGVVAGVADLCILQASGEWHGLFIEMKTEKGKQTESQKAFEKYCDENMYRYQVARSFENFVEIVEKYLLYDNYC